MVVQINIGLTLDISTAGVVEVLGVSSPTVTATPSTEPISFSYAFKVCDIRYGIVTLGAKHVVSQSLTKDSDLTVQWHGEGYPAKSHKSTKGRIDGLTSLFRENPDDFKVGHQKTMRWDAAANTLEIE